MALCNYRDVRRVMNIGETETPPTDEQITRTIEEQDAWIQATLPYGSMNAYILRELSAKLTAIQIATPDPYHVSDGGTMVTGYPIAEWQRRVDQIISRYRERYKDTIASPTFDETDLYDSNRL